MKVRFTKVGVEGWRVRSRVGTNEDYLFRLVLLFRHLNFHFRNNRRRMRLRSKHRHRRTRLFFRLQRLLSWSRPHGLSVPLSGVHKTLIGILDIISLPQPNSFLQFLEVLLCVGADLNKVASRNLVAHPKRQTVPCSQSPSSRFRSDSVPQETTCVRIHPTVLNTHFNNAVCYRYSREEQIPAPFPIGHSRTLRITMVFVGSPATPAGLRILPLFHGTSSSLQIGSLRKSIISMMK